MKTTRGFEICVPKHVWFSSESSLGIKTHARDEFHPVPPRNFAVFESQSFP